MPSEEDSRRFRKELMYLIIQFLKEEKFEETIHMLEQESALYFDMNHFGEMVLSGNWDELERYLLGFTGLEDNEQSMKVFFIIRRQKYLEALDRKELSNATEIVMNDLKVFAPYNEDQYKGLTNLLTLENIRENEELKHCGDTKSMRAQWLPELKKLIEINPLFLDKLQFPNITKSRLKALIFQSFKMWKQKQSQNPMPEADGTTNFLDCVGASPTPAAMNTLPTHGGFPLRKPYMTNSVIMPVAPLYSWTASSSKNTPKLYPRFLGGPIYHYPPLSSVASLKFRATTSSNPNMDPCSVNTAHALKWARPLRISESALPRTESPTSRDKQTIDDLPKYEAATLNQGYTVTSIDFHPSQPTLLLVGTDCGDISVWEVSRNKMLAHLKFKLWKHYASSTILQSTLAKDPSVSVNRVRWSDDGKYCCVAYSKHLMHVYMFHERKELLLHLEVDSHIGGVNDIGFWKPNKEFFIVTCGDDKTIKVWDANTGDFRKSYEGHEGPVYSICPRSTEKANFIISTSIDGKIMFWLYTNWGSGGGYKAPGQYCTCLSYSADGSRLFSSGITKDGDTYIAELCESGGFIKREYSGLGKGLKGFLLQHVQFDTARSKLLAVGDEYMIKFWDVENAKILTTVDVNYVLPMCPRLCFNRLGSLLAVSTNKGIKILANGEGRQLLFETGIRLLGDY